VAAGAAAGAAAGVDADAAGAGAGTGTAAGGGDGRGATLEARLASLLRAYACCSDDARWGLERALLEVVSLAQAQAQMPQAQPQAQPPEPPPRPAAQLSEGGLALRSVVAAGHA
jgi:hypothetical protein